MNAAESMQSCLSEEVLAAFIDQRLDPASRLEVVQHLADCGECRDIVVAANEYSVENGNQTGTVVHVAAGRVQRAEELRPVRVNAGVQRYFSSSRRVVPLAAAAAIVVGLFGVGPIRESIFGERAMTELVEAANAQPKRATEARLSGNFDHRDHQVFRGNKTAPEVVVQMAALRAQERAARKPSVANLHAAGVGHLLMKQPQEAVEVLQKAASADTPSAELLTDLAAAYLTRSREGDAELALAAAERAWALEHTPAAAWNRALALDQLGRNTDAIAMWQEYLKLDPNSEWAKEVRNEHLSRRTEQ